MAVTERVLFGIQTFEIEMKYVVVLNVITLDTSRGNMRGGDV